MSRWFTGLFALVLTVGLAACGDSTSFADEGTISVLLTDEEGAFDKVVVQIDRVELIGDGSEDCDDGASIDDGDPECDGDSGDGNGRIVLSDTPVEVDLIELSNDIMPLAEDLVVPGGTYSQIRLVISEGCLVLPGVGDAPGEVYASSGFSSDDYPECDAANGGLQMPSWGQSGLKVKLPGGSIEVNGDQHIVLLDFVVSESFAHQAGNSGKYVARPVIRATEIGFTGSITVELSAAEDVDLTGLGSLGDFEAQLDDEEPVRFEETDVEGVYAVTFLYVVPGHTYSVSVGLRTPEDGETWTPFDFTLDPESPQDVPLGSSEQAEVAFVVTSASAPGS
jgi:hypothetical protein